MNPFEAIKAVAFIAMGGVLGWGGSGIYAEVVTIPAARQAGRAEERIIHSEQLARAEAKARVERDKAQTAIDAVEAHYYARDKARVLAMTALEQALEEEQARAPIPPPADRGAPCVCRPPVSRGVRDALQGLGRATARPDSAKPDAAVRGSR
jgi:hypothetical protein